LIGFDPSGGLPVGRLQFGKAILSHAHGTLRYRSRTLRIGTTVPPLELDEQDR